MRKDIAGRILLVAGAACLGLAAATVRAGFLGHSVQFTEYEGNTVTTPAGLFADGGTQVVGAGTEPYPGLWTVDISDTQISLTSHSLVGIDFPTTFPFFVDSFFDVFATIDPIVGASLNSTNIAGLGASRVLFDADHVYLNFANIQVPGIRVPGDGAPFVLVDVQFETVPAPATAALLAFGLGVLGIGRWRASAGHQHARI